MSDPNTDRERLADEAMGRDPDKTNDSEPWAKTYVGSSKRWGRTHNPENFQEALSNALADVAQKLLSDEAFAAALTGPTEQLDSPQPLPPQSRGAPGG